MSRKTRVFYILYLFGLFFFCLFSTSQGEEGEGGGTYIFRFEPTITESAVSGHEDKFRELFQIPDDVSGGLGLLSFDHRPPGGQEIHFDLSAKYEDDYHCGVQFRHKDLWSLDLGFQNFKIYSNDAREFYTFPPASFLLDRNLDVNRRDLSFKFLFHPEKSPQFSFTYERKNKYGDQLLLRRGQLDSVLFYNLPLSSDTYNKGDLFTFQVSHNFIGTNVSLTQRVERFESRIDTDQNQYNNDLGFFTQARQEDRPEFRNATTTFSVDRTIGKNLFMVGQYWFRDVKSEADYSKFIFSPVTGLLQSAFDTTDTDSDADLTSHMFLVNLNYLLRNNLTLFGGIRYVDSDKDASSLNVRRDIFGFIDLTQNGTGDVNERKWSGVGGFKFSGIPRTTLDYEARLERADVDFRERLRSSRGFIDDFDRNTDADFDTTSHVARINVKPWRPLFLLGQYKYSKLDRDYDDDVDTTPGYPAFLGDWDNQTNEFTVKTLVRICRPLTLTFKYQDRDVDYDISKEGVSKVAETDTQNYNAALTYSPLGNLFLSFMFNHQDTEAETRGKVDDRNFPYDLDVDSFMSTVNFLWNEKLSFTGTLNYAEGDGTTQNLGGDGTLGEIPLDYTLQSYSLGINYKKSSQCNWQVKYLYADYDEDGMGGIDDFDAHIISGRVYFTF